MSENPASQTFINAFNEELKAARPIDSSELTSISGSLEDDLANTSIGYFSHEDWNQIIRRAGTELAKRMHESPESLTANWHKVLREFHGQGNWGFRALQKKPKIVRPPEPTDGLGWYLWAVFQPMTLTKVAILYFGAQVASNPKDTASKVYLGVAVLYMFFSLGFFAWRQNKKNNKAK